MYFFCSVLLSYFPSFFLSFLCLCCTHFPPHCSCFILPFLPSSFCCHSFIQFVILLRLAVNIQSYWKPCTFSCFHSTSLICRMCLWRSLNSWRRWFKWNDGRDDFYAHVSFCEQLPVPPSHDPRSCSPWLTRWCVQDIMCAASIWV